MTDNAKKFMEKVSSDQVLRAQLDAALKGMENAEQIPALLAFARKHGFEFSEEDFAQDDVDIDLNELEAITGGTGCGCPVLGAGVADDFECVCGVYGTGGVGGNKFPSSQGGCQCVVGGAGATNRH